jgi:hypothetical protein
LITRSALSAGELRVGIRGCLGRWTWDTCVSESEFVGGLARGAVGGGHGTIMALGWVTGETGWRRSGWG